MTRRLSHHAPKSTRPRTTNGNAHPTASTTARAATAVLWAASFTARTKAFWWGCFGRGNGTTRGLSWTVRVAKVARSTRALLGAQLLDVSLDAEELVLDLEDGGDAARARERSVRREDSSAVRLAMRAERFTLAAVTS